MKPVLPYVTLIEIRKEKRRRDNRERYRKAHPNFRKRRSNRPITTKEFILDNVKIDPVTGCWEWLLGKTSGGYGSIWNGERHEQAHCVAYKLWIGQIPDGLYGCHTCDNPCCCNPNHIFPGSQLENMRDAVQKGRQLGFKSKISNEQAIAIKNDSRTQVEIAKDYGVTRSHISLIKRGGTRHNL